MRATALKKYGGPDPVFNPKPTDPHFYCVDRVRRRTKESKTSFSNLYSRLSLNWFEAFVRSAATDLTVMKFLEIKKPVV